jgi:hypothetical protein
VSTTAIEARRELRGDLVGVRSRLVAEFSFELPVDTVVRHVALAREELAARQVRDGLPKAVEALARERLLVLRAHPDERWPSLSGR